MFGLYRTILAINVMAYHLLSVPAIGPYAVISFFILSGFLMTTIMHNSYGYSLIGLRKYAVNRFLRLYPIYWTLITITCLIIVFIVGSDFARHYHKSMVLPSNSYQLFTNIFMVFPAFEPHSVNPRLSPATWAITIELFYYLLIGLGLSRNKKITLIWFCLSLIYSAYPIFLGGFFNLAYGNIFNTSLPFSLGAMIFFYKEKVFQFLERVNISSPLTVAGIFMANLFFVSISYFFISDDWWKIEYLGRITNLILSALMVIVLYIRGSELFSRKFDKFVGDYSYPIYLFHWTAAVLASYWLYQKPVKGLSISGVIVFIFALIIVLIITYMINAGINSRIDILRKRVKERNAKKNIDCMKGA